MPDPGDKVKLVAKQETVEGILMPSSDANVVLLKLDNGYNVGFEKKEITKMEVLLKKNEKKVQERKVIQDENLPIISILHTGGTIASKVDYRTGGVVASFSPADSADS